MQSHTNLYLIVIYTCVHLNSVSYVFKWAADICLKFCGFPQVWFYLVQNVVPDHCKQLLHNVWHCLCTMRNFSWHRNGSFHLFAHRCAERWGRCKVAGAHSEPEVVVKWRLHLRRFSARRASCRLLCDHILSSAVALSSAGFHALVYHSHPQQLWPSSVHRWNADFLLWVRLVFLFCYRECLN